MLSVELFNLLNVLNIAHVSRLYINDTSATVATLALSCVTLTACLWHTDYRKTNVNEFPTDIFVSHLFYVTTKHFTLKCNFMKGFSQF